MKKRWRRRRLFFLSTNHLLSSIDFFRSFLSEKISLFLDLESLETLSSNLVIATLSSSYTHATFKDDMLSCLVHLLQCVRVRMSSLASGGMISAKNLSALCEAFVVERYPTSHPKFLRSYFLLCEILPRFFLFTGGGELYKFLGDDVISKKNFCFLGFSVNDPLALYQQTSSLFFQRAMDLWNCRFIPRWRQRFLQMMWRDWYELVSC